MKTFNENREELVAELIKFSVFFILFIITMNAFNSKAESLRFQAKPNPSAIQNKVRSIYTSQIGVRENQPNSGPEVEKYLRYVKLSKGNPWCAAFVCWAYGQAGVSNPRTGWSPGLFPREKVIWEREPGTKNQESRLPHIVPSGYSTSLVTRMEPGTKNQESRLPPIVPGGYPPNTIHINPTASRCAYPPLAGAGGGSNHKYLTPTTGDVFALYFPEKGRIAHTGFIDQWDGTWLVTVEGNTNVSGSREGDGVYRKRRLVRSIFKVARYID